MCSVVLTLVSPRLLTPDVQLLLTVVPYGGASVAAGAAAWRAVDKRWAWVALTGGIGLYACGDIVFTLDEDRLVNGAALFDVLYCAGYVCLAAVVPLLVATFARRMHVSIWLDAATVGLGGLAAAAAFLLTPVSAATVGDQSVMALVYICADVVLMASTATLASILGRQRARAVVAVFVATGLLLVGDLYYYAATISGAYLLGGLLDNAYSIGLLILAWVAHRSPRQAPPVGDLSRPRLQAQFLVLPVVGACLALVVVVWGGFQRPAPLPGIVAAACIAAGLVRVLITLSETRSFYEVRELAGADPLTGLANRRALTAFLDEAVLRPTGRPVGVLLIDVDQFREVNHAVGSVAADDVLCQLAERLQRATPSSAMLARLSGDCFALAVPDLDPAGLLELADQVQHLEDAPVVVAARRIRLTLSIGVASARPGQGGTAELLHDADVALVQAQHSPRGIAGGTQDAAAATSSPLQLVDDLHEALTGGGIEVWLQPQLHLGGFGGWRPGVDPPTSVAGCEALVRWRHPQRGILGPAAVLAVADHGRLLPRLTAVVIDAALDAVAQWWPAWQIPVSVNLSAQDLDDPDLPDRIATSLAGRHLPPWALTVEVVEDTVMLDAARARRVLGAMRELGVAVSIDDYGTGYSSLAYLHELPVDELKIDRSLTTDVVTNREARAIVRHSVALAHDLGLSVVAEGVEDAGTLRALHELGCDVVQGFLVARPMPLDHWLNWLLDHHAPDGAPSDPTSVLTARLTPPTGNGRTTSDVAGGS